MKPNPARPVAGHLPFHQEQFSWKDFERFVHDYLNATPRLTVRTETSAGSFSSAEHEVVEAQYYGIQGQQQFGIDLLATTDRGEKWAFQCKHWKRWRATDANDAAEKAEREYRADRYFLLVSCEPSPASIEQFAKREKWQLWGGEKISVRLFLDTPRPKAFKIVENRFGPQCAKEFFPLSDDLLIEAEEFFKARLDPNAVFHHRLELESRDDDLERLHQFIESDEHKVLILHSRGGVGKSRLLKSLADEFDQRHPDRVLRFTNPQATTGPESLRYEEHRNLVVVHDDAHRLESIPHQLVGQLSSKEAEGAKLILAARPQARAALERHLMEHGFNYRNIVEQRLKPLRKLEMEKLAAQALGPALQANATRLADLADGCALIVSVAAHLWNTDPGRIDLVTGGEFTKQVFNHLLEAELPKVAESSDEAQLKALLYSLALLSPWEGTDAARASLAKFLGLSHAEGHSELDDHLESLQSRGLLLKTSQGYRILPDLLSDHLAYEACFKSDGRATKFVKDLLDSDLTNGAPQVMRNLAEADWRASEEHDDADSIFSTLWPNVRTQFENSSFWDRAQIIQQWASFSVFQPHESLELARSAIDLDSAPPAENSFGGGFGRLDMHKEVLRHLPGVLKPVARYQDRFRDVALDLLLRLHTEFSDAGLNGNCNPVNAIADVADLSYFPATEGVVKWMERLLATPDGLQLVVHDPAFCGSVLAPVFARFIEESIWDRNQCTLRAKAVDPAKTKELQKAVLTLVERSVEATGDPRSVLNTLTLLQSAIADVRSPFGGQTPAKKLREWRPYREEALLVIARLLGANPTPILRFKVRAALRQRARYDSDKTFARKCQRVIDGIAVDGETQLVTVVLSNDFDECIDKVDTERDGWQKEMHQKWIQLVHDVAANLLRQDRHPEIVARRLAEVFALLRGSNDSPSPGYLLAALVEMDRGFSANLIDLVMSGRQSELASWLHVLMVPESFPPEQVENWLETALLSPNLDLRRAALYAARRNVVIDSSERIRSAFLKGLVHEEDLWLSLLSFITNDADSLPNLWRSALDATFSMGLSDAKVLQIADAVANAKGLDRGDLPESLVRRFLDRLLPVLDINQFEGRHRGEGEFFRMAASRVPRRFYEFLRARYQRWKAEYGGKGESEYVPIPWNVPFPTEALRDEPDFEQLCASLLQEIQTENPPGEYRLSHLFQAVFLRSSSDTPKELLRHWLAQIGSEDQLERLVSSLKFDGSMVIFTHPDLTREILRKARTLGSKAFEKIQWDLIRGAGPGGRGYSSGVLDDEYQYFPEAARKAASKHARDPVLASFYEKIVEVEEADARRHLREVQQYMEED